MGRQLWNFNCMWNWYKIKVNIDVYVIKMVCFQQKFGKRIWKQGEIYIDTRLMKVILLKIWKWCGSAQDQVNTDDISGVTSLTVPLPEQYLDLKQQMQSTLKIIAVQGNSA